MIKHVVMWKLKEFDESSKKLENALQIKTRLEILKNDIPEIQSIEVGINSKAAPIGNYDVVLTVICKDFKELKTYAQNPLHLKVGEFIKSVVETRVAVDCEI
ncbi:Dabb family protein [Clostridium aestuarii]|uniref:Dabb family protein n=1 Tax=Clostridium aestuarii TaxID=338193 RepID=A0ABT4D2V9_9CLOT|nr:Dabb family protein [Clostridium aestuarii]MCY6485576.1 Dabb family protein [Clostridium aestuarii]